jgi:hypothetical protein
MLTITSHKGNANQNLTKIPPHPVRIAIIKNTTNGKKHMKKCSPSLAIKEMQIKTSLRFHFTPVRIAITKNTTNNMCC